MSAPVIENVEASWARLGVLFHCAPAAKTPDVERLLVASAKRVVANARLFPLLVTWLTEYGNFVAKHRLKRLIGSEGDRHDAAVLGLLLECAISHGATPDLSIPIEACRPVSFPRPLFDVDQDAPSLAALAERTSSALGRKWRLWSPEIELKRDALRPVAWLLDHNPSLRDRIMRKGDLRCSILETLRRDCDGIARSESELARLSGATRAGVRKALAALIQEGEIVQGQSGANNRDHPVSLRHAA